MRREGKRLVDAKGTKYVCVPFFLVEEYGFGESSVIEYDRSNPKELIIRVRNQGVIEDERQ